MLFQKKFIRKCIRNHSKELENGAALVMKAQELEKNRKYEKAIKYYKTAKKMFENAKKLAELIGDKEYQAEAQILIKKVDEQLNNAIVTDFYRGGIDW